MKQITFFTGTEPDALGKYCRRASAAFFILLYIIILAGSARAQSSFPFAGRYSGEWVAHMSGLVLGEREHVGTWNISIDSGGEITGVEFDKTGGDKGNISGFIDEDGFIKVFVKYTKTVTIKGVLEKKGARLTGTLKQTCSSGDVCATLEMILKRQ